LELVTICEIVGHPEVGAMMYSGQIENGQMHGKGSEIPISARTEGYCMKTDPVQCIQEVSFIQTEKNMRSGTLCAEIDH
jgi:hypothetical protein